MKHVGLQPEEGHPGPGRLSNRTAQDPAGDSGSGPPSVAAGWPLANARVKLKESTGYGKGAVACGDCHIFAARTDTRAGARIELVLIMSGKEEEKPASQPYLSPPKLRDVNGGNAAAGVANEGGTRFT